MKILLMALVVLVLAWRWRAWRESRDRPTVVKKAAPKSVGMVACHHCGVHIPADDAVTGALGSYCSTAHRLNREP